MAKVFFLTPRFPHPLDKGDKLRAFYQIQALSSEHEVMLGSLSHEPVSAESIQALEPFCRRIEVASLSRTLSWMRTGLAWLDGTPFQVAYFSSPLARRRVRRWIDEFNPDHIVCQLIRSADYVRDLPHSKTLDYMDAFSRGLTQRIDTGPWFLRNVLRREQRAVRAFEGKVAGDFDHLTIISDSDRQAIAHAGRDRITLLPNGVDLEAFSPANGIRREEILFVGNMAYAPNIAAAQILARDILPLVRRRRPECRLVIAGTTPTRNVRRLESDAVTVTGWVDDMSNYYARARVFVAPMTTATGIQNKLLQAMAAGVPCITSSIANQALGAGLDEIIVADTPRAVADAIESVLSDPERSRKLARNGRRLMERRFDWPHATQPLNDIIRDALATQREQATDAAPRSAP